jgi:arabinogalactan oligomer / maltooligosaccharide transport system permease protein
MIEQTGEGSISTPDATLGAAAPVATAMPRVRSRAKLRPYERSFLWFSRAVILGFILLMLVPVFFAVQASFSAVGVDFTTFRWIPEHPTWPNYANLFDLNKVDYLVWLRNSAIVCIGGALLSVLLVVTTGYAFSRFRFIGRKYGLMSMLLLQMFPAQMNFIAFYYLLNKVQLLNTFPGLILVYLGASIAFFSWLFKGYVDGLPRDLEESAYVDGATPWQAFYKIILPLTRPMMAVVFIFALIQNFNEYILASWILRDSNRLTMSVGMRGFINGQYSQNWTEFAAAAVLSCIPILLVFMIAQRWLVSGLAAGAVKG